MNISLEKLRRVKDKYEKKWMQLPEVQAVGIGHTTEGKPGIIITVSKLDKRVQKRFPSELEGASIELRQGGPFSAK